MSHRSSLVAMHGESTTWAPGKAAALGGPGGRDARAKSCAQPTTKEVTMVPFCQSSKWKTSMKEGMVNTPETIPTS